MGYLPQFKKDIFVSYKHASNQSPDRWVDTFLQALEAQLEERIGKVTFWRDTDGGIQGGDDWMKQIYEALDTTAIFLAILTPQYLGQDSKVCAQELDHFLKRLHDPNEAIKPVIMPVHKLPPDDGLPQELEAIQYVKFFQNDPFLEYVPEGDDRAVQKFYTTLAQLAQYLSEKLKMLRGEIRKQMSGTVYLATVSSGLHREREKLRSDLLQRGYWVVPEHPYLWNSAGLESTMASELNASDLCIHLVGPADANEPETMAHAKLQLERAVEAMRQKGRPAPLAWIKPGTSGEDVQPLIDYVKQELPNYGGDWCEGSLEEFKTLIVSKLPRPVASPSRAGTMAGDDLALIVTHDDLAAARKLREILINEMERDTQLIQIPAVTPGTDGSPLTLPHRCGKAIIFWGSQTENQIRDTLVLDGLTPYRGKERLCLYIAAPETDEKRDFMTTKARVILATATADTGELSDFIKAEVGS